MHVVGGCIQYSVTHSGEIDSRRYYSRKVRGVGSDLSFITTSYVLHFVPDRVEWSYSVQG